MPVRALSSAAARCAGRRAAARSSRRRAVHDRERARGFRLNIAAGTAVRFEPGQSREVTLVALAGKRTVYGFRADVMGKL